MRLGYTVLSFAHLFIVLADKLRSQKNQTNYHANFQHYRKIASNEYTS